MSGADLVPGRKIPRYRVAAAPAAEAAPVRLSWKEARATLPEVPALMTPWPAVEIADPPEPLQTPEAVEGLLAACPSAQQLMERCRDAAFRREVAERFIRACADKTPAGSLLLDGGDADARYWVVGDVHGSLTAIAKVWAWIQHCNAAEGGRHVLVFLGDVLDRGSEDLETLAFIQSLYLDALHGVYYICGNHDAALGVTAGGVYTSSVLPSETQERLNTLASQGGDVSAVAKSAMRLASISPRMIEIAGLDAQAPEKTVLLAHGGVPHTDLQEELYRLQGRIPADAASAFIPSVPEPLRSQVAEDFLWLRLADNLPFKRPNRNARGCEIGTDDVNSYRSLHHLLTGRAVTCIIRGHDHERDGFRLCSYDERYNKQSSKGVQRSCAVLTLNTMEPMEDDSGLFPGRRIAVACLRPGAPLTVYALPSRPHP